MNAWYLSLNTRLFSSEDFACKLRNKNEYQLAGVQGEGLYYSRMITRPSDSNCVVKYTLKWLPSVRCRRAQYTLTAACIFDKIRSIKRAIHSGVLVLKTVRSDGLRTWGRCDNMTCIASIFQSISIDFCLSISIDYCLFCVPKITRNIDSVGTSWGYGDGE